MSDLIGNPEDRFSRVSAHIISDYGLAHAEPNTKTPFPATMLINSV